MDITPAALLSNSPAAAAHQKESTKTFVTTSLSHDVDAEQLTVGMTRAYIVGVTIESL